MNWTSKLPKWKLINLEKIKFKKDKHLKLQKTLQTTSPKSKMKIKKWMPSLKKHLELLKKSTKLKKRNSWEKLLKKVNFMIKWDNNKKMKKLRWFKQLLKWVNKKKKSELQLKLTQRRLLKKWKQLSQLNQNQLKRRLKKKLKL